MKKIFSPNLWKYLIAFLIPTFLVLFLCGNIDNDTWYVAAEGREIVEHGLYYTDQLSMHEGLEVTVQNYGFAAFFYLIYNALGPQGVYLLTIILNFIFMIMLYKLCMFLSNKNTKLSLIITSITDSILAFGFIVTRAQMVDYIILTSLIYVLELFIKTKKTKYLWWIPVFSLFLINVHGTSWWFILAIISAYLIDGIKKPKLHLQGYQKKPIVLISLLSFALGFINPYGYKMITLIFTSYGNSVLSNMIIELNAFRPFSGKNIIYLLSLVSVITLYIYGKRKIKIRHLLLFFGFLALGLNTTKALSELAIAMLFPLAYIYQNWKIPPIFDLPIIGKVFTTWTAIVTTCLVCTILPLKLLSMKNYPSPEIEAAFTAIDNSIEETTDKKSLKIYVGYNNGGYAELRGYRPYLDPRGEVFLKKNNKKADIIEEWADLKNGDLKTDDFLEKYNFDYLVTSDGDKLHNLENEAYSLIYTDKETESTVNVYKRTKDLNN